MMQKLLPHIRLEVGSVNGAVLVCGDPARATAVAGLLDEAVLLAEWREYRSYQGKYHGRMPAAPVYETMAAVRVLAVEMECAALFQVGSLRQIKTGAILAADGNVLHTKEDMSTFDPHREEARQATEAAIRIALEALVQVQDEPD